MNIENIRIAWTEIEDTYYGVAHDEKKGYLGNVRISECKGGYEILAFSDHNFKYLQSVESIRSSLGSARDFAEGQLTSLLKSA